MAILQNKTTNTEKKIGKIVYVISATHNPKATETIFTKVERLIKRDLSSRSMSI